MLEALELKNFRNFETAEFDLRGSSVVFRGANGRGKTSVLEAIHFISTLRSFRTSRTRELQRIGSKKLKVQLTLKRPSGLKTLLRIEDDGDGRRLFLSGNPVYRASEFADQFKCVAFLPDDPVIVTGSPVGRRRFLDMFLCLLDREYFLALQKYASALKSRNHLLKTECRDTNLLSAYAAILAENGAVIVNRRIAILAELETRIIRILSELRPELSEMKLLSRHSPETPDRDSFFRKLEETLEKDRERFATMTGPHLDDFDLICGRRPLRNYGSRGQCRLVSLALKLAELEMASESGSGIVVLADDATADLDRKARDAFLSALRSAEQVFYAFTDLPDDELFRSSRIIDL